MERTQLSKKNGKHGRGASLNETFKGPDQVVRVHHYGFVYSADSV